MAESGLYFDEGLEIILNEIFDQALLVGEVVQDIVHVDGGIPSSASSDDQSENASDVAEDVIAPSSASGVSAVHGISEVHTCPNSHEESPGPSTTTISVIRGVKRLRECYRDRIFLDRRGPSENNNNEQDQEERGSDLITESQPETWDNDSFSSSDESTPPTEIRPLFNEGDLHRLSYDTLRSANRNFERILDLVGRPLTYQETEEIIRDSQRDIVTRLQTLINSQQQRHDSGLHHMSETWRNSHDRLVRENQELRGEVAVSQTLREVRGELQLSVIALTLMGQRLDNAQRVLTDLFNITMRERR